MANKFDKAFKEDLKKEEKIIDVPRGYKLVKEGKTFQTSFVLKQSTREALDTIRSEQGKSRNELVNDILEAYIDNYFREKK